jgi:ABC-2 type transport system ATP-binding protein
MLPGMDDAIIAEGLGKTFRVTDRRPGLMGGLRDAFQPRKRDLEAVKSISLRIPQGEIVGYLGPNGAGKSTTIKMLTGIMVPTRGTIRVNGFDPQRERSRYVRTVGAVFGQRSQLWWDLAVGESFELLRRLYDVPEADFRARMERFEPVLGLSAFLATPVRKLSLGQRMKADLAASLLHAPRVLFLDEPTVGLDVVTKERLRAFLREINRELGTTILLTTHDLQDISALCPRVVVIDHGSVVHDGGLEALVQQAGARKRIRITLAPGAGADPALMPAGARWTAPSPVELMAEVDPGCDVPALLQQALGRVPAADVQIEEPSIEEVVKALYAGRSG